LGAEFAQAYPKIAARLRLGADGSQDPHVERLVQAFAYLNARTRHKLDDDFPELTDALLGILYPHYLAPTPSMSIVQFLLDRSQAELTAGYEVRVGTAIETEGVDGEPCRFRTCYPVRLWPLEVTAAELHARPFSAPPTSLAREAVAMFRIELHTLAPAVAVSQLGFRSLRFYLHAAQSQNVFALYELLFNHTLEIAVAASAGDDQFVVLPKSAIKPVGFSRDEGLWPYSARSFLGYRLLSEFFALPQKFLFFELTGLDPRRLPAKSNRMEIFFLLNRTVQDLEHGVSADVVRLGCTPIANLFEQRADPFVLTQRQTEYRIIPDARRPRALEIYSVNRVRATSPEGEEEEYYPFYSVRHTEEAAERNTFWYATRRPGEQHPDSHERDNGTEVYLSLVDLKFSPAAEAEWTVEVETTCVNRDLPQRLPFGTDRPRLDLPDGRGPISRVICLLAPTPTRRPPRRHGAFWRLVSHLSLNHLSIAEGDQAADALREILKLYDVVDSEHTQTMIQGLLRVRSRRIVGRAGGVLGGLCRGVEIDVQLDEQKFSGSGAYLFGCVLDRFLGLYCSLNSFTKLVCGTKQREGQGEPWRWPPRTGEKIVL
jgi:type VI secretion system protein ImpG